MPKGDKIIIDPSVWTFEEYVEYIQAVQDGELETAFLILKPAIVSWPYKVSLAQDRPDLDPNLPFTALPEIIEAVGATLESFFDRLDPSEVEVDLSKWSMESFYRFSEAAKDGDVPRIEMYLKQVARPKHEDYDEEARLSFYDGVLMRKAVEEAQKVLFRRRKTR